jgi:hypothetical protein
MSQSNRSDTRPPDGARTSADRDLEIDLSEFAFDFDEADEHVAADRPRPSDTAEIELDTEPPARPAPAGSAPADTAEPDTVELIDLDDAPPPPTRPRAARDQSTAPSANAGRGEGTRTAAQPTKPVTGSGAGSRAPSREQAQSDRTSRGTPGSTSATTAGRRPRGAVGSSGPPPSPGAAKTAPPASRGATPTPPQPVDLPADPGYDVLTPADGASSRRRPARKLRAILWAAAILVVCLAVGGAAVWGWWPTSPPAPSGYEAARARAARPRPAPAAAEETASPAVPAATPSAPTLPAAAEPVVAAKAQLSQTRIDIGVAYGTEKRTWLEWATHEFAATEAGRRIHVQLIPLGSLEAAHAILDGDRRIHVWSPASSLYRETFVRDWEAKYQSQPILEEEPLALTPMVLVMWKSRYEAIRAKVPHVSLRTIRHAMRAAEGWNTIAAKPAWGRFKFGHTHPNQSNSGLMTLIVLAYEFHGKSAGLTVSDIMSQEFQDFLTDFRTGLAGVSNSTGNMMKEMALKGPTKYDALFVYESVAIDYLGHAEGRWEPLRVMYPQCNLWNDNPYYILSTPWTTTAHQEAAGIFLKFLLSAPIQERALDHGFRPANPAVRLKGPNSPFEKLAAYGLSVDLPLVCEVPSREVVDNLQQSWLRAVPRPVSRP